MWWTQKVLQAIKRPFEYAHWDMNIYWISSDALRNSTTITTLIQILTFYILSYVFFCLFQLELITESDTGTYKIQIVLTSLLELTMKNLALQMSVTSKYIYFTVGKNARMASLVTNFVLLHGSSQIFHIPKYPCFISYRGKLVYLFCRMCTNYFFHFVLDISKEFKFWLAFFGKKH